VTVAELLGALDRRSGEGTVRDNDGPTHLKKAVGPIRQSSQDFVLDGIFDPAPLASGPVVRRADRTEGDVRLAVIQDDIRSFHVEGWLERALGFSFFGFFAALAAAPFTLRKATISMSALAGGY
jgi:hypothetical protein